MKLVLFLAATITMHLASVCQGQFLSEISSEQLELEAPVAVNQSQFQEAADLASPVRSSPRDNRLVIWRTRPTRPERRFKKKKTMQNVKKTMPKVETAPESTAEQPQPIDPIATLNNQISNNWALVAATVPAVLGLVLVAGFVIIKQTKPRPKPHKFSSKSPAAFNPYNYRSTFNPPSPTNSMPSLHSANLSMPSSYHTAPERMSTVSSEWSTYSSNLSSISPISSVEHVTIVEPMRPSQRDYISHKLKQIP